MNYLAEILTFNNWIKFNSNINKSDICLWHALISIANRFRWKEFNVPIQTLIAESKLTKNDIYKSRNKLKQFGLIDFKERSGNQASIYIVKSIVSLYGTQNDTQSMTQIGTQNGSQSDTESVNIRKTKNKNIKQYLSKDKYIGDQTKKSFGEYKNVSLTPKQYAILVTEYGENEALGIIQHLDDWIEMKGSYKVKSHYLAIKRWVIDAYKSDILRKKEIKDKEERQKNGGQNYGANWSNSADYEEGKINVRGEPWCTKFPE